MSKTNLFSSAKDESKKSSKKEMLTINIDTYEGSFDKLSKLSELNSDLKSKGEEADILSKELKEIGKSEWIKFNQRNGENPGSFILQSSKDDDIAQVMFVTSDKYISIKSKKEADELIDMFGEDIIDEKTDYIINPELVNKYSEVISNLINDSIHIEDEDKEKIIKAVTTYSIRKGTVDNLDKFGDIKTLVETIKPVYSLKDYKLIKG